VPWHRTLKSGKVEVFASDREKLERLIFWQIVGAGLEPHSTAALIIRGKLKNTRLGVLRAIVDSNAVAEVCGEVSRV
jgi:hypothetical protein